MTTKRQFKKLVRGTIERNPGLLILSDYMIWQLPIRHVASTILIQPRREKSLFTVQWALECVYAADFLPSRFMAHWAAEFNRADYKPEPGHYKHWSWEDPDLELAFSNCVQTDVLPLFQSLASPRAAVEYVRNSEGRRFYYDWDWHLVTTTALGEFEAARTQWLAIAEQCAWGRNNSAYHRRTFERLCELGEPLMADDHGALARILHRWEAENVRGTAIEPYWQPSPFPFEEAGVPDVAPGPRPAG